METGGNFDDLKRQFENLPIKQFIGVGLTTVIVVLLAWAGLSCFYKIEADEVGVVLRFGRYTGPPTQPGLHFKMPFGIDQCVPVKVDRVHKLEFGYRTTATPKRGRSQYANGESDVPLILTGDQNVVSVEWIVQYKIKDPADYLFKIRDPEESIRDAAESTMRLVIGDSSATEALGARREEIAYEAQQRLQARLDLYRSGIDVQTVELQNIVPPTRKVEDAFNAVNEARQDKETRINEARKEFQQAIPQAQGQARRLVTEAEGYKLRRINEALGDVAKYVALSKEYERSKEVTRNRLYLEAMQAILPGLAQVYVVEGDGRGPLQVLDLTEAAAAARVARRDNPPARRDNPPAASAVERTRRSRAAPAQTSQEKRRGNR